MTQISICTQLTTDRQNLIIEQLPQDQQGGADEEIYKMGGGGDSKGLGGEGRVFGEKTDMEPLHLKTE